jgi:hypothetical protein
MRCSKNVSLTVVVVAAAAVDDDFVVVVAVTEDVDLMSLLFRFFTVLYKWLTFLLI